MRSILITFLFLMFTSVCFADYSIYWYMLIPFVTCTVTMPSTHGFSVLCTKTRHQLLLTNFESFKV